MIKQLALIFIFFVLLLCIFLVYNRKTHENFELPTQTAVNVPPINNESKFYVGNKNAEIPDEPIVSETGKYEFRKQELLYDGVWGERCKLDGDGNQSCDWKETSGNYPLNKKNLIYGTNKFFNNPEKKLEIGEVIVSKPDCPITAKMYDNGPTYLEHNRINPPFYLNEPSMEDILGFPKQDNELYWDHAGVILGDL